MRKRVNDWRLIITREHDTRAFVLLQITNQRSDPGISCGCLTIQSAQYRLRDILKFARLNFPCVVGDRACVRWRCLDDVETIHLAVALGDAPARHELTRVAQITEKSRREKITIERQDSLCEIEAIRRIYRLAERHDCTRARVIAIGGFILMPFRLRQRSAQLFYLRAERRRDDRLSQKTNARALFRTLLVENRAHFLNE